jgi:parallel beta-helix repeat protein
MEQYMKWIAPALALGFGLLIGAFVLGGSDPIREQVVNTNPLMRGGENASGQGGSFRNAAVATGERHVVKPGMSIQQAVKDANPGDIIEVHPGSYKETVYIDKDSITMTGVVVKGVWPTLDGEKELNDAFLYSGNNIVIENFKIQNYKGNGIMGQAGNNFIIRNNWILDAGVYGIFPEFGKNGIVEHNIVTGIADAAIYVGMSDNIDVIHNEVYGNVAGIEFENTRHGLAEGNYVYDNAGGILVFISQGLPIKTNYDTIIRNNFIVNNNHENFAIPGSTVAGVPSGTGVMIMASDDVVIENNIISGNDAYGITAVDFATGAGGHTDLGAEPNTDRLVILDNIMHSNGNNPPAIVKAAMATKFTSKGPDIIIVGGGGGHCIHNVGRYRTFGTEGIAPCDQASQTTASIHTMTLDEPAPAFKIEADNEEEYERIVGSRAYYAVCTGCHAYGNHILGPPVEEIQAAYEDDPDGLAAYINEPYKVREGYPEMPPQNYLSEETRLAVAKYILTVTE